MRGGGCDGTGAAPVLPAERAPMRMGVGLFGRVAEHVVEEAHQATDRP
jgi:hypothetical protein